MYIYEHDFWDMAISTEMFLNKEDPRLESCMGYTHHSFLCAIFSGGSTEYFMSKTSVSADFCRFVESLFVFYIKQIESNTQ